MASKKKAAPVKREPLSLFDVNVVAPDFFTLGRVFSDREAVEFVRRAAAFYDTMSSLNRAVILCRDADENTLYLASVEDISNV